MDSKIQKIPGRKNFALVALLLSLSIPAGFFSLYSIEFGKNPRWSVAYDQATIGSLDFNSDGTRIVTAESHKIEIWDSASGEKLDTVGEYVEKATRSVFADSDRIVITGGSGKRDALRAYDLESHKMIWSVPDSNSIDCIAVSAEGKRVAVGGALEKDYAKSSVQILDVKTGKLIQSIVKETPMGKYVASALSFSPDGRVLAVGISNKEKGIEIYDANSGKKLEKIQTKLDITALTFDPKENRLVAGTIIPERKNQSGGGTVQVYRVPGLKLEKEFTGLKGQVTSLDFYPDGRYVAATNYASKPSFTVYDLEENAVAYEDTKSKGHTQQIAFSPDGHSFGVVYTTFGNMGNPTTMNMFDVGSLTDLRSTGALNDLKTFTPGTHVKVRIDAKWYSGTVNKTEKKYYLIQMDNEDPEYWKWVSPGDLRPD